MSFPFRGNGKDNRALRRGLCVGLALVALGLIAIPAAVAAFAARSDNPGNVVTAAPDFTAPVINSAALGKVTGGATGFVKAGGTYYVYANVAADTGNPPSGIATVLANASNVTPAAAAVPLVAGSYSAGGTAYNYRSAPLVASPTLAEGSVGFTVTASDVAGNSRTLAATATVDNSAPQAADVQTTNAGANGLAELGDSVVFSFNEPVEPESILAGWDGSATSVVVRAFDNGLAGLVGANDALQVYNAANSTPLPLGTVDLGRGDYVAGLLGGVVTFGASGTPSTMTMSGNTVTVVLGTYGAATLAGRTTATGTGTLVWTPVATPSDRAGNTLATTAANESGAADRDF